MKWSLGEILMLYGGAFLIIMGLIEFRRFMRGKGIKPSGSLINNFFLTYINEPKNPKMSDKVNLLLWSVFLIMAGLLVVGYAFH